MCSSEFTYKWDLTVNDLTKLKSLFFIFLLLLNGKCLSVSCAACLCSLSIVCVFPLSFESVVIAEWLDFGFFVF